MLSCNSARSVFVEMTNESIQIRTETREVKQAT